ncbi:putative ABC transporter permease subunit [Anaerolentibacter hominis]|uniref:putative ABC transporter permease subunit n=1 Tax=Anaerolentibacter hominis TaxID=3079009 RepID=UPI0031B80A65
MRISGKSLFKIELLRLFGINKALHSKQKAGAKSVFMGFAFVLVGLMMIFYVGAYCYSLGVMGLGDLILPMCFALTSFVIFFTTTYKANGTIFNSRDYDIVMSFPVKTSTVVASRIVPLYILDLGASLMVMIPALVMYIYFQSPGPVFYIYFLISLLFIPMIPIVLAMLIGAVIAFIASRFRFKNLVTIVLSMALVVLIMVFSMNGSLYNMNFIADISQAFMAQLNHFYPLTRLYVSGIQGGNFIFFALFLLCSVGILIVCCIVIGWKFKSICSLLSSHHTRKNYRLTELKTSSQFQALFRKERKRYFSSSIYVMNTAIGPLLLLLAAVASLFFGQKVIEQFMEIPGGSDILTRMVPFLMCFCCGMCCSTASSLSLEGRQIWILKSSPVAPKTIYKSKIVLNLLLNIPAIIISAVLFYLAFQASPVELLSYILMPAAFSCFMSVVGMLLNIKLVNYNWTNETQVVKQSAPTMIVVFASIGAAGIGMVPALYMTASGVLLLTFGIAALLFLLSIILYKVVSRCELPA